MRSWFASTHLLGIASPMVVWALYFVTVYSVQGTACARSWRRIEVLGMDGVNVLLVSISIVTVALLAWIGVRAQRRWRSLGAAAAAVQAERRRRFAAAATGLLSLLALMSMVMIALPLFFLPPCA